MNIRPLSKVEHDNLSTVKELGLAHALVFLTRTGLKKSILDATIPFRSLLREEQVHDYDDQQQGPDHKVLHKGVFITSGPEKVDVSLYRPVTKNGDPRFWISNLTHLASPDDVLAAFVWRRTIHFVNLTRENYANAGQDRNSRLDGVVEYFTDIRRVTSASSMILLGKLKEIAAAGPLVAVCSGDTAIGRTLESALGIAMNSSEAPDFQGIEIKASRQGARPNSTRQTLFACVPNWRLSKIKSSRELLVEFGSADTGQLRLYCTVSSRSPNPQGLKLVLRPSIGHLVEQSCKKAPVDILVWELSTLHNKLTAKHRETFWIKADTTVVAGRESFQLVSAIHTTTPNIPSFDQMLDDGSVTVDHLVKGDIESGANEKGPLFKIDRRVLHGLFKGEPREYKLR